MRVKLFTHSDLDGVGCSVVCKTAFENVDVVYCDYNDVNIKIADFLENEKPTDYDRIFITDISVTEDIAERLDMIHRGGVSTVNLVDHHGTAKWLVEKYPAWAEVRAEETNLFPLLPEPPFNYSPREKVLSSGTSLFYKFLRNKHLPNIEANSTLKMFAETVRRYDTWEWHNVYKDDHPKRLNDLLYLIGREAFVERFSSNPLTTFTDTELKLLEVEQYRINKYIWKKKQEVKRTFLTIGGHDYNVAYVFAEQYGSLLGNAIAEELRNEVDFVALFDVSDDKVSIRGVHDHLDLGKDVAKYLGEYHGRRGGGHPKACAFQYEAGLTEFIFNFAFATEEENDY